MEKIVFPRAWIKAFTQAIKEFASEGYVYSTQNLIIIDEVASIEIEASAQEIITLGVKMGWLLALERMQK